MLIHTMKLFGALLCLLIVPVASLRSEILAGRYDMAAVRDPATLETKVIEDWHPSAKEPSIRQKLIEITVCEWWPGQKVRLPVTFSAPVAGGPCKQVVVGNQALVTKTALPTGSMLRLLKEQGVGIVLIGMVPIDNMDPVGRLDVGMKEHLLKSKDMRFAPAWIWGLSDMRALTAALVEKEVFQPQKVIATGGSKRGVGAAAAGIADERFTGIMPVVAPIIDSPGGPYVEGMMPQELVQMDKDFIDSLPTGKHPNTPSAAGPALVYRQKLRSDERITFKQAYDAGWSAEEIKQACTAAWEVCRITNYLPALKKRGLEIFYNEGSNDNVSPGLLELGKRFPDFPLYVIPGGQHGGAKEAGFLKQVGGLPDVEENLYAFAQHHFFGTRPLVATPKVVPHWDKTAHRLSVTVTFPDHAEPQQNDLWYSLDRHPDYTLQMEYDAWQSVPLSKTGTGVYSGEVVLPEGSSTVDLVSVHGHAAAGSTLTLSGPLMRKELR
ncbi:MAG: hypothetical protein JWO08_1551 [Verrucomicrobiaceae bacterium]|nr:hypothetical protein [Verrucomicrobiaceae bacterium]